MAIAATLLLVVLTAGSANSGEVNPSTDSVSTVELMVRVHDIAEPSGFIAIAVYDNGKDFPGRPSDIALAPIVDGLAYRPFQVTPGRYAILAFQDLNSNGELDRNLIGLPREPFAVSGKPRKYGPPSWRRSQLVVDADHEVTLSFAGQ